MEELLKAWGGWLTGHHVIDYWFAGHQIWWWGRVGKVLVFVGGAAVIAEIIGSQRLHRLSTLIFNSRDRTGEWLAYALIGGLTGVVISVAVPADWSNVPRIVTFTLAASLLGVAAKVVRGPMAWLVAQLAKLMNGTEGIQVARVVGLTCLAFGFHFDLLAS